MQIRPFSDPGVYFIQPLNTIPPHTTLYNPIRPSKAGLKTGLIRALNWTQLHYIKFTITQGTLNILYIPVFVSLFLGNFIKNLRINLHSRVFILEFVLLWMFRPPTQLTKDFYEVVFFSGFSPTFSFPKCTNKLISTIVGGDEMSWGYVQYVPVISSHFS